MSRGVGVTVALRDALPEWTVPVFEAVSLLGDLLLIVPLLALLYAVDVLGTLRADDSPPRLCSVRTAWTIAVVFGGLALIVLLETLFAMGRPPAELHATTAGEYGFPSGHTMAATVFWGTLAWSSSMGSWWGRATTSSVIVAVVGLSRLALGVHYLVDVLAAIAFGVGYLAIAFRGTATDPGRAFVLAAGVATLAVLVSAGSGRSLLALAGTIGAAVGWWMIERPPVRRRLGIAVGRGRGGR